MCIYVCQVYCDMTAGGGWMRVVDIDPNRTRSCNGFEYVTFDSFHLCRRVGACDSTEYWTHGKQYSEVRGYTFGYQVRRNNTSMAGCSLTRSNKQKRGTPDFFQFLSKPHADEAPRAKRLSPLYYCLFPCTNSPIKSIKTSTNSEFAGMRFTRLKQMLKLASGLLNR